MEAIIFSDTHGKLNEYVTDIDFSGVDLLIFLGDNLVADFESLKNTPIRKIGVLWNNDPSEGIADKIDIFQHYWIENVAFNRLTIGGLSFIGIDWSVSYMLAEDSPETTKNIALIETKRKLLKFVESNPADIILSHFSCAGVMSGANLMYRGLKTLRTYIERNSPRYLFHGHLHNPDEFEFLGTRIVQVYPWKRVSFKG